MTNTLLVVIIILLIGILAQLSPPRRYERYDEDEERITIRFLIVVGVLGVGGWFGGIVGAMIGGVCLLPVLAFWWIQAWIEDRPERLKQKERTRHERAYHAALVALLRRAGVVDFSEHTDDAELEWRLRQIKITDQEMLAEMQVQRDKTFAEYFEQWWRDWWRDVNQWTR